MYHIKFIFYTISIFYYLFKFFCLFYSIFFFHIFSFIVKKPLLRSGFICKELYVLCDDDDLIYLTFYVQKIQVFLIFSYYLVDMFFSFLPPPNINLHYYNNKFVVLSINNFIYDLIFVYLYGIYIIYFIYIK